MDISPGKMRMINNIVFDMGNVLVLYDPRIYIKTFCSDESDAEMIYREVFNSVEWIMDDRGTITEQAAISSICKRLPKHLYDTVQDIFANWHNDIPPFPEIEELVARLKSEGYKIFLLSNTGKSYYRYRINVPALKYFDGEFISADWHMLKPEREIYLAFCGHFRLIPAECFFIDDNSQNVEGAIRAGMQGAVFHGDVSVLYGVLRGAGIRL